MTHIFCYHGLVDEKSDRRLERNFHTIRAFEKHVALLRWMRGVLPDELLVQRRMPSYLITFDDGYRNNLIAAELLAKYRMPWILFVSSGAMGREKAIWTVELSLLILHGEAKKLELMGHCWSLITRAEREAAFQAIRYPMKEMPSAQRLRTMEEIRSQFPAGEAQRLLEKFPAMQMMTWEEVRQLASTGVFIGSHGVDHELHHVSQPPDIRVHELSQSRFDIELQTGHPCSAFAFPNGTFVAESSRELKSSNYRLGFTMQPGSVSSNSDPYLLPRLHPHQSLKKFLAELM
jgi:peptidoglycan/xylan/chitin deacetylase (PgdA/CDA1 family)